MNIFDLYRMPTAPKTNQRYWTRKRRLDHARRTRRSKAFEQRITKEVFAVVAAKSPILSMFLSRGLPSITGHEQNFLS